MGRTNTAISCATRSTRSMPTTPRKDRLSVLDVLRNGRERLFRLNDEALGYLEPVPLSKATRQLLLTWCREQDWMSRPSWSDWTRAGRTWRSNSAKRVIDAAAVAAYHAEEGMPIVRLLVCDDAPQFNWLTEEMALCWVHEGRHYKKLMPVLSFITATVERLSEAVLGFLRPVADLPAEPNSRRKCPAGRRSSTGCLRPSPDTTPWTRGSPRRGTRKSLC